MATIERRVTELERTHAEFAGPLVLIVRQGLSTPEQQESIDEANKAGRLVVLVSKLCEQATNRP